jgi:predicted dehydrogenase
MPLNITVIGLGHMGKIHLKKLLSFEEVRVCSMVDSDKALLGALSQETGVRPFSDWHDAINSCDAAIIATPTETHHVIGKAFLEAGKHIFLEKPVTTTIDEAQELINLAASKKLVFQVGHLERFNPAFIHALSLIKKPVLIEAVRVSPFTGRSTDVDVVLDLMIHDLDLVLSLTGDTIGAISGHGVCFMTDKTDAASARIEFTGGCVANITASRMSSKKQRSVTIYEADRHLFVDLLQGTCSTIIRDEAGNVESAEFSAQRIDPVHDELSEFLQSVSGGGVPAVTGADGLRALILAARINASINDKPSVSDIEL